MSDGVYTVTIHYRIPDTDALRQRGVDTDQETLAEITSEEIWGVVREIPLHATPWYGAVEIF